MAGRIFYVFQVSAFKSIPEYIGILRHIYGGIIMRAIFRTKKALRIGAALSAIAVAALVWLFLSNDSRQQVQVLAEQIWY